MGQVQAWRPERGMISTDPFTVVWGWEWRNHLQLARKVTLHFTSFNTQESCPYILSGQHSEADPVDRGTDESPQNVSIGDLALPLICHMAAWAMGREEMPYPYSFPLKLRQVGELAPWSWEQDTCPCPASAAALWGGPCTSVVGPEGVGVEELTLRTEPQPLTHCCKGWTRQGNAGELVLVVRMAESRWVDESCNHIGPGPELWVSTPQHLFHL